MEQVPYLKVVGWEAGQPDLLINEKMEQSGAAWFPLPKEREFMEGNEDAPIVKELCSICLEAKNPSEILKSMLVRTGFVPLA